MKTRKHNWKRPVAIAILVACLCSVFFVPSESAEAAVFGVNGVSGEILGPEFHAIFNDRVTMKDGICTVSSSEYSNPNATLSYNTNQSATLLMINILLTSMI